MFYRADYTVHSTRRYMEPYTRSRLPCRTKQEMQALYPNGDYIIIGEIGVIALVPAYGDMLLAGNGMAIPIWPRGSMMKPIEWVAGYIPMVGDAYATAAASVFPAIFRRWVKATKAKNIHFIQ